MKISEERIKELNIYYDAGNSIAKCVKKFGIAKTTISKYVNVRPRTELQKKQRENSKNCSVKQWLKNVKVKLLNHRGGKCVLCGYNKYVGSLTFHHINPSEKSFTISGKTKAYKTLLEESEKCVVLCANCHGEVHAGISILPM